MRKQTIAIVLGILLLLTIPIVYSEQEIKEITEIPLNPLEYLQYKLFDTKPAKLSIQSTAPQQLSVVSASLPAGTEVDHGTFLSSQVTLDWEKSTKRTKIAIIAIIETGENKEINILLKESINEKERKPKDITKLLITGIPTAIVPEKYVNKDYKYSLLFMQYIDVGILTTKWELHGDSRTIPFKLISQDNCYSKDETKCIGDIYFICDVSEGKFDQQGRVVGECGVVDDEDKDDIEDNKCYKIESNRCTEIECIDNCRQLGDCYVTLEGCDSKLIELPGCEPSDYVCYDDDDDNIKEIWVRGTCKRLLNKYADCEFGCHYVNDQAKCKESSEEEEEVEEDKDDIECKEYYWFNELNLICQYSEFCGKITEGIYTFNSLSECNEELAKVIVEPPTEGCTEDKDCDRDEICVDRVCEKEPEPLNLWERFILWILTILGRS